jgi:hypothetical protein
MSTSLKALLIAAVAIGLLFVIGDRFGFRSQSKEPRTYVMELDTAGIVAIHFEDRRVPAHDLLLMRTPEGWERQTTALHEEVPGEQAQSLLARFERLKVKRTMGMIRLLGERYDLTDSTLCRITFTHADGREAALHLGSSTFAPGKVGAWTYVNVPEEREVYAVEGLLTSGLRGR